MLFLPKQLKRKKQLSFQYWLALVIIFIAVIIPILVQEYVILKQENYAYIINISGRQRMLSQRTTLLARELVSSENLSRQKQVRDKLLEATELMEKSHFILVTGQLPGNKQVINSDKVINLYHEYPLALDRKVKQHITLMRRILSTENFTQSKLMFDPFTLSGLEKQNLLASLNKMVKQYEVESNRYTEMVKIIQLTAVIIILLTLGGAVFFIFRPMIRTVVQHEGMLNNILDTIPVLMDVVDEDHIIQYQSKKLIELMGHDSIGKTCYSVYKDDNQLCHHCPIKSTNNSSSLEVNHCLGNRTLNITHVDIQFNDKKAVLEVFHDVSAQKKTHDLLLQAKNSAEQANLLKSEFLANMSHEIRTPMNGVLGLTSLLQETKLNLEQQELVTAIESSADTLMVIINDILDFSKVEAGKLGLEYLSFDLEVILQEVYNLFLNKCLGKKLEFKLIIQAEDELLVNGDQHRIRQILANLISNAIKFTDIGGITLQVSLKEKTQQQLSLLFEVIDTGIGIPEPLQKKLFDAFIQADGSVTREYGGTGLGLTICKQLVGLMGGEIGIHSQKGHGANFWFAITLDIAEQINEEADSSVINDTQLADSKAIGKASKSKVLLVEDNKINQMVAQKILIKYGYQCDIANNGQLALDMLNDSKTNQYALVLMDCQMPVMDGFMATKKIRRLDNRYAHIPIIAMTANAMQGDREKCLASGMDDYLTKPINQEQLNKVIKKAISKFS